MAKLLDVLGLRQYDILIDGGTGLIICAKMINSACLNTQSLERGYRNFKLQTAQLTGNDRTAFFSNDSFSYAVH